MSLVGKEIRTEYYHYKVFMQIGEDDYSVIYEAHEDSNILGTALPGELRVPSQWILEGLSQYGEYKSNKWEISYVR